MSNRGFRHLARYIRGREAELRATWFLSANLPGVTGRDDLELACKLVDAIAAQNNGAGSKRTYHHAAVRDSEDPAPRHHFVATRPAERDARAIRRLKSRQRERDRSSEEREL